MRHATPRPVGRAPASSHVACPPRTGGTSRPATSRWGVSRRLNGPPSPGGHQSPRALREAHRHLGIRRRPTEARGRDRGRADHGDLRLEPGLPVGQQPYGRPTVLAGLHRLGDPSGDRHHVTLRVPCQARPGGPEHDETEPLPAPPTLDPPGAAPHPGPARPALKALTRLPPRM